MLSIESITLLISNELKKPHITIFYLNEIKYS